VLIEHYTKALLSTDKCESLENRLAANIIVTMRKLEYWLGEEVKPIYNLIEEMHVLFRIEYDKLVTIESEVIATSNEEKENLKWKKLTRIAHVHR
jgi:hypothetical protein